MTNLNKRAEKSLKIILGILTLSLFLAGCGNSSGGSEKTNNQLATEGKALSKQALNDTKNRDEAIKDFPTKAPAEDVATSNNALFIAEGDNGVEILKIGFNDKIEHEYITTISGINASFVALSSDQTKLFVQNKEGFVNIFNIKNIKSPQKERIIAKQAFDKSILSKDKNYKYIPKEKQGMEIYDVRDPLYKRKIAVYSDSEVYSLVLVDHDTKALTATKTDGINLLDIADHKKIHKIGNYPLSGKTLGLSVNDKKGLLFVANGDKGVKIFNLNILIDSMLQ